MDLKLKQTKLKPAGEVKIPDVFFERYKSGIEKVDALFGGPANPGILPGSSFTLTARAGCGKTTLMLQWLEALHAQGYSVAIISGEESVLQISYTAQRLGVTNVQIANMTDIDAIAKHTKDLDVLVIDSFQSMRPSAEVEKKLGKFNSRKIEKYCVETFTKAGQDNKCVIGFIMHHTKGGQMKGGTIIAHTVDANFIIYQPDMETTIRVCETDGKNRFAPGGNFSAALEAKGYDFTVDHVETSSEENKRMGSSGGGKKGERRRTEIAELLKHEKLSLKDAAGLVRDMQRARFLMSDLHLQGLFKKTGRGDKALFVRTDAGAAQTITEEEPSEVQG